MSRSTEQRLTDIAAACNAIASHLASAADAGLIFDAIRIRLVEMGEAVKDLDAETLAKEPTIPWADIAQMRDLLAHRYFDSSHSIVMITARRDVPLVHGAASRLMAALSNEE